MHNQSHRIKLNTKSKLGVIVLSIVLLTGISLVPTLQIGVQGRGQPHRLTTPGASPGPATSPPPPTPGTSAAPSPTPAPPTPGTSPPLSSPTPAPPTPGTSPPLSSATIRPPSGFGVVGEAANQGATVVIPQSSVMTMLDNLQTAMNAVDNDNKDEAMTALNSANQELRNAATAAGMSVGNTTDGG
jgi:hypothetical protein